jgi:protein SCO1
MQRPSRTTELAIWGLLTLTVLVIVAAFLRERMRKAASVPLPPLFTVRQFSLTNQSGRVVSTRDLAGSVWVADVFFTTCAGPCPRMSGFMAELQNAVDRASPVQFVSITTDPERDTPEVLSRYGKRFGADPARWHFLTGSKAQIQEAAVDALKFTALEKDPGQRESPTDLFIHSTLFVLVDKRGQVRGVFEVDEPGVRDRLLAAIRTLVAEPL